MTRFRQWETIALSHSVKTAGRRHHHHDARWFWGQPKPSHALNNPKPQWKQSVKVGTLADVTQANFCEKLVISRKVKLHTFDPIVHYGHVVRVVKIHIWQVIGQGLLDVSGWILSVSGFSPAT